MSKRNKGKKKHRSPKQTKTSIEKMLESMNAWQVKYHLTKYATPPIKKK